MNSNPLNKIVLIGASTGGPGKIQELITQVQSLEYTCIIIAQHMAREFMPSFIKRLNSFSPYDIVMAEESMILESGAMYVCSEETAVIEKNAQLQFKKTDVSHALYNPNINVLFYSLVPLIGNYTVLSAILTGIGDDGVDGCKQLSERHARCLTETTESAIVDGMPSRARERIAAIEVLEMRDIIETIKEFCH